MKFFAYIIAIALATLAASPFVYIAAATHSAACSTVDRAREWEEAWYEIERNYAAYGVTADDPTVDLVESNLRDC